MSAERLSYWIVRGKDDARADKSPLIWKTVSGFRSDHEPPPDWTAAEEREISEAYCRGYEEGSQ